MTTQPNLSRLVEQQTFVSVSHSTLGADFFGVFMNIEEVIKSLKGVSGVYRIHNTISGKSYVGKGVCVGSRLYSHLWGLRKGEHANFHLQASFNKHGEAAFEAFLIMTAPMEDLNTLEVHWIQELDTFKNGYNQTIGGEGCAGLTPSLETRAKLSTAGLGHLCSSETRTKISNAHKGKTLSSEHRAKLSDVRKNPSPETRAKLSVASLGRKHSLETRAKMSVALRGRKRTPEQCARIAAAHRGKTLSSEHRAKISAANHGQKRSPETCAKIGDVHRGKTMSLEAREKMSVSHRGKKLSPEHCAKISASKLRKAII